MVVRIVVDRALTYKRGGSMPGEGLFEKLYGATTEAIKSLRKPLVKKALKRKLRAALDDASSKVIDATTKIDAERAIFDAMNVNVVVEQRLIIERCDKVKEMVKAEYKELFGEDMVEDTE
jgi:hypothetical protein